VFLCSSSTNNNYQYLYHLFVGINLSDFIIITTNNNDKKCWSKFTVLKKKKPSLKIYILVRDWDVEDKIFSNMV
jgi:chitinase